MPVKNLSSFLGKLIDERGNSVGQRALRFSRTLKRNPIRQHAVARRQRELLRSNYAQSAKSLIVFVNTSVDMINGGVVAICKHYSETAKMKDAHGAETALCTAPGCALLLRYTKFNNDYPIYGFSSVLGYFRALENLIVHIPEYMAADFVKDLSATDLESVHAIERVQFNIMLQNVKGLKAAIAAVGELRTLGSVTCTTAHEKYSTRSLREELGVPVHWLSVPGDPADYQRKKYSEKENLMIVSPDAHPLKQMILERINSDLPHLETQVISGISYEAYKETIEKAKFALTFGEGLDGYFTETIFSGGIGLSVFNEDYFTEEFRSLCTVYDSYDSLADQVCADIRGLDDEKRFADYQQTQFALCCRRYSRAQYETNLSLFYRGLYTHP